MTNEEKAMEIVSGFDAIGMLVEMAEWKDQQAELLTQTAYESGYDKARQEMKEYLEKMQKEFTDDEAGYYVINRIINELFKED